MYLWAAVCFAAGFGDRLATTLRTAGPSPPPAPELPEPTEELPPALPRAVVMPWEHRFGKGGALLRWQPKKAHRAYTSKLRTSCPMQRPLCDFASPQQDRLGVVACLAQRVAIFQYAKWIPPTAHVLELGSGGYGQTTCLLSKLLDARKGGKLVSVASDPAVWSVLEANLRRNECPATLVKGTVGPLSTPYGSFNTTFDTLAVSCSGCLEPFLQENPDILDELKIIIVENHASNDPGVQRLADQEWKDREITITEAGNRDDDGTTFANKYADRLEKGIDTDIPNPGIVFCRGECEPSNANCSCCG